jgi:hypothetical protein
VKRKAPPRTIIQPPARHPSGRPILYEREISQSFRRLPPDEPLTPGLRSGRQTYAIGFRASLTTREDE